MANQKKKFYETSSFKALNAKWNAKLKEHGFEDLDGGEDSAIIRPQVISTQKTQYSGGTSYFDMCQEILRTFQFKKDIHRTIFSLHAEGKSQREIQSLVESEHGVNLSQPGILKLIARIKKSFIEGPK